MLWIIFLNGIQFLLVCRFLYSSSGFPANVEFNIIDKYLHVISLNVTSVRLSLTYNIIANVFKWSWRLCYICWQKFVMWSENLLLIQGRWHNLLKSNIPSKWNKGNINSSLIALLLLINHPGNVTAWNCLKFSMISICAGMTTFSKKSK